MKKQNYISPHVQLFIIELEEAFSGPSEGVTRGDGKVEIQEQEEVDADDIFVDIF